MAQVPKVLADLSRPFGLVLQDRHTQVSCLILDKGAGFMNHDKGTQSLDLGLPKPNVKDTNKAFDKDDINALFAGRG